MLNETNEYTEAFDQGADWQLTRCTEIVSQVIRLQTMVTPDDEKLVNKLHTIIEMMECRE
jgi:hypothetical protein|tara:strand:- start:716 stop:895 length:180 start_codon:yes stop_codon:yes gene_type:complete